MLTRIAVLASLTTALIVTGMFLGPAPAAVEYPTGPGAVGSGLDLPLQVTTEHHQTWRIER